MLLMFKSTGNKVCEDLRYLLNEETTSFFLRKRMVEAHAFTWGYFDTKPAPSSAPVQAAYI